MNKRQRNLALMTVGFTLLVLAMAFAVAVFLRYTSPPSASSAPPTGDTRTIAYETYPLQNGLAAAP